MNLCLKENLVVVFFSFSAFALVVDIPLGIKRSAIGLNIDGILRLNEKHI